VIHGERMKGEERKQSKNKATDIQGERREE
jgi:hypothetical protein